MARGVKRAARGSTALATGVVDYGVSAGMLANAGLEALKMVAQSVANAAQIKRLETENDSLIGAGKSNRGRAQVLLAIGIYAKAVVNPELRKLISDNAWGKKAAVEKLGKALRFELGMSKAPGTETDEARSYQYKADGDDPETLKQKESVRTNFSTMLQKSTKVALHALDNGIALSMDPKGMLIMSDTKKGTGAIESHFGAASVTLNEDQNLKILDKKGQVIETKPLKAKPSFTEVMRKAGESHDVVVKPRVDSRVRKGVSTDQHIIQVCEDLQKSITKMSGNVSDPVRKALASLVSAIKKATE